MKAALFHRYGPPEVLQIEEVAKPAPKDDEVLIRIHATAVSSGDSRLRRADPFAARLFLGLFAPRKKILGGVLSGVVEATGSKVGLFRPGDQVFGATGLRMGAHAEYICLPETGALALKPAAASHAAAAAIPFGGTTALHFLQKAGLQRGQKVLVYGASGAVGTAAVQLAKYMGAEVTGVCSTANLEKVKSIGADHVIDYTKTDFAQNGPVYDLVFETVNKTPVSACLSVLKKGGTLILGAAMLTQMMQGAWASITSGKKVLAGMAVEQAEQIRFLARLMEEGAIMPVIDKSYPLEQIADAHRHVDGGRKKGNVVVRLV